MPLLVVTSTDSFHSAAFVSPVAVVKSRNLIQ